MGITARKNTVKVKGKPGIVLRLFLSALAGTGATTVALLAVALLIRLLDIPVAAESIICGVIKVGATLITVLLALPSLKLHPMIAGAACGTMYIAVSLLVFVLLAGTQFSFAALPLDFIIGIASGTLWGMLFSKRSAWTPK